ncbi:hypothetical protein [Candidatus Cyrtobacter comes]|uniref:hypothetical protein n=1 Tax=Candidatus Cyrtobacter comes TaxID=675776 RepID=UPI002ACD5BA5|nr:hypothetical protein [Candidatus Cyrtobacter comes]
MYVDTTKLHINVDYRTCFDTLYNSPAFKKCISKYWGLNSIIKVDVDKCYITPKIGFSWFCSYKIELLLQRPQFIKVTNSSSNKLYDNCAVLLILAELKDYLQPTFLVLLLLFVS